MKVIDPGHKYLLDSLDGGEPVELTFVKREGEGYPGNVGHHPGTNIQEVLRALIDRLQYVDNQQPHHLNPHIIEHLRICLIFLEIRAAKRHDLPTPLFTLEPETMPTCPHCGHMACKQMKKGS